MTDFEALYRSSADPWAVRTSWYERRKEDVLMASLPRVRYCRALELGCGTGAATGRLAAICDAVCAVDISATAARRCRQRMLRHEAAHVQVEILRLPEDWPEGTEAAADLVVVSELAYYFSDHELDVFIGRCLRSLAPLGDWAMCHYKAAFHDRCQDTDHIHDMVDAIPGLDRIVSHHDERFQLDIWRRQGRGCA